MKACRSLFLSLASVLLAVFVSVPSPLLAQPIAAAGLPAGDDAVVSRVVSGDTLEVKIKGVGFTIGYLGIDAPNAASAAAKAECYSAQATAFNSRLVSRQTLRVEREVSDFETNGSGRLLRWAFLPDGRLVNEEMVKAGYALASNAAPDQKYMAPFDRRAAGRPDGQAGDVGCLPWDRTEGREHHTSPGSSGGRHSHERLPYGGNLHHLAGQRCDRHAGHHRRI